MSGILAAIEARLTEYVKPKEKDDWKEKTFVQLETLSGMPRERIVTFGILMSLIYVLFGNFLPLFSHVICILWPVKESFKILNKQTQPSDTILLYWILYGLVSLFDFSLLPGFPFYYFAKTGLFLWISGTKLEKLREWSEPAMRFTESWVFLPSPPQGVNEKSD